MEDNKQHPYQCVVAVPGESPYLLVAACGHTLLSITWPEGEILTEWIAEPTSNNAEASDLENDKERPAKRRKTNDVSSKAPFITKMAVSPDGKHIVVVTDDKFVRVVKLEPDGYMKKLSERCMPKRLCAIEIMPDNATILCGDKFGDVYSMPLLPAEQDDQSAQSTAPAKKEDTAFKPAASDLTIHTKRNRKALESQRNQKSFTPKKEALQFEHQLLLGHVSMLTDMKFAERSVDGKKRTYIITSDRDEHIRVSRGPPQAHIIENYCLMHTQYVSKMCLIPGTDLLISGGGDAWLGIWDWPQGKLLGKVDVRHLVREEGNSLGHSLGGPQMEKATQKAIDTMEHNVIEGCSPVTVAGLTTMKIEAESGSDIVLVLWLEKRSHLWLIKLSTLLKEIETHGPSDLKLSEDKYTSLLLLRHPLDVTSAHGTVIVSTDERTEITSRLAYYDVKIGDGDRVEANRRDSKYSAADALNNFPGPEVDGSKLDSLLYGIADLRKRRDGDDEKPKDGPLLNVERSGLLQNGEDSLGVNMIDS